MKAAPNFSVNSVVMDGARSTEYRVAMNLLIDVVESRGGEYNDKAGWLFLVGLSGEDTSGNVALSIATLQRLPESIVELGKTNEAFYLNVSAEERAAFEPEGKHIREYVSEEYLRQFVDVQGHYIKIVQKSQLKKGMEEIVDQFIARHYRQE